jgi:hypothetical protein
MQNAATLWWRIWHYPTQLQMHLFSDPEILLLKITKCPWPKSTGLLIAVLFVVARDESNTHVQISRRLID